MAGSRPVDPRAQLASQLDLNQILNSFESVISDDCSPDEFVNLPEVQAAIKSDEGNKIKYLGGDNNKNYIIKNGDDTASVVLQLSTCNEASLKAVASLSKPDYFAKCYRSAQARPVDNSEGNISDENQLPRLARVVELCDSNLDNKVKNMDSNNRVMFAAELAGKCSAVFKDLSQKNILWTDFKPGNLLLRSDNSVAVADTKAFIGVDDLKKDKNDKVVYEDVTKALCSRAFIDAEFAGIPYEDRQKAIESEYNYQLAVLLHHVATGELVQNDTSSSNLNNIKGRDGKFNTDDFKEVYSTDAGKHLSKMINGLKETNPVKKVTHQMAAGYLSQTVLKKTPAPAGESPGALAAKAASVSAADAATPSSSAAPTATEPGVKRNIRQEDSTPMRLKAAVKKNNPVKPASVKSSVENDNQADKPTAPRFGGS